MGLGVVSSQACVKIMECLYFDWPVEAMGDRPVPKAPRESLGNRVCVDVRGVECLDAHLPGFETEGTNQENCGENRDQCDADPQSGFHGDAPLRSVHRARQINPPRGWAKPAVASCSGLEHASVPRESIPR
jgi:hypothetical protein